VTRYLEARDLVAGYGTKEVLHGVSLGVEKGEIVTLIGHNGAGKSTTMSVIAGLITPTSGSVLFEGRDIAKDDIAETVVKGLSLVPQGRAFFADLSVEENLRMAGYTIKSGSLVAERTRDVYGFFPRLRERRSQSAGSLSGGEQRMLSIGMALVMSPKVMLLDEPTFGLAPLLATEILDKISSISHDFGTSILLVVDNLNRALSVATRVYVMKTGRIIMENTAEAVSKLSEEELWDLF
jgi:branched-chain amino acid transport system ATP-binding protein